VQQSLLSAHPDANVRVYAIWLPIFPDDARETVPAGAFTDRRVVQWWDQEKLVGRWYAQRMRDMERRLAQGSIDVGGTVLWDAYVVYGPDARWNGAPTGLHRWGRPILATRASLNDAFDTLVNAAGSK
jgi:hypothetical protein